MRFRRLLVLGTVSSGPQHRAPLGGPAFVIEIRSSTGKGTYPVRLDPPFCPCRDFQYRGDERPCKHLIKARAMLAETAAGGVL